MNDTQFLPSLSPDVARQIDRACDGFEAAWKSGQRPDLQESLNAVDEPARSALLRHLLYLDWEYRRRAGDQPKAGDYYTRFPGDSTLIEEISRDMAEDVGRISNPSDPDSSMSRYELLEEVGQGAIGVVYRGRDRVLGRQLAVKVLREAYHENAEARSRFKSEARVGSQLQHPAIVPVYELGAWSDQRPFITMKLVEGHTLAALLQGRGDPGQDLPRILGIFEQVCQAIAYAHARGIVHRDLKPANIMVGTFGEVQVMDWGFAKQMQSDDCRLQTEIATPPSIRNPNDGPGSASAGARSTSAVAGFPDPATNPTGVTASGAMMGTPAYMPPEQARGETALIDRRADVFALGAMLCEILTGSAPYVGGIADEVCHKAAAGDLREAHERLDTCAADHALKDLAKRCLVAERGSRPPDAGAVVREMTAYLTSAQERLRQAQLEQAAAEARAQEASAKAQAERRARRLTLGLAAAVLLLILGAATAPGVGYVLVRAEQKETEAARQAALEARNDEARRRQQTRQALDMLTGPVIEEWLGKQFAITQEQERFLKQALAIYSDFAAETSTDETSREGLARAYHQVGDIQRILGRMPQAEEAYNHGAELYSQLSTSTPEQLHHRKELVRLLNHRIIVLDATGRGKQAETALRAVMKLERELVAQVDDPELRSYLAVSLTNLSNLSRIKGRHEDAETQAREAVELYEKLAGENPKEPIVQRGLARARSSLATILAVTEKYLEAEQYFRVALKEMEQVTAGFPQVEEARQNLGTTYATFAELLRQTKQLPEAEKTARRGIEVLQQLSVAYPARPALREDLALAQINLARVLIDLDRHKDAELAFREAIGIFEKLSAEFPGRPLGRLGLARAQFGLGPLMRQRKRPKDAEAADREAVRLYGELVELEPSDPEHRHYLAGSLANLAQWHHQRGEFAEARRLLEEAMLHNRAAVQAKPRSGENWQFLCNNRTSLALTFLAQKQHEGLADAVNQLVEAAQTAFTQAGVKFPRELSWGAAFLARCATLAEKDPALSESRRSELAKSYADQAITTLRIAVAHGFRDSDNLRKEPFFASVRNRSEFKEMQAELERTQKKE